MSRIGKRPIKIVQDIKVSFEKSLLEVKGPKGELELRTHPDIDLVIENETLSVISSNKSNSKTALIGTTWKLINNSLLSSSNVGHKTLGSNLVLKDLRVGTYRFQFSAEDNLGTTASDTVMVTVTM